jgi:hypothetical protein
MTQAVILFMILYEGASIPTEYATPFQALSPGVVQSGTTRYNHLPTVAGLDMASTGCQHGSSTMRFPIGLLEYDISAQRKVYETFNDLLNEYPEFNTSLYMFEGYSLKAVKDVPAESTAFPHRGDNLLMCARPFSRLAWSLDNG